MGITCPWCNRWVNHLRFLELPDDSKNSHRELCENCWKILFDGFYKKDKEDIQNFFHGVEKRYDPNLLYLLEKYPVEFRTRLDKNS